MNYTFSIIIPTYNRAEILNICLDKIKDSIELLKPTLCEVIVINDGSTDNTEEICQKWQTKMDLKYIKQKNSGQGVARNKGIEIALGKIIIFLGDDIFINKTYLNKQLELHQKFSDSNIAILGLILWDPNIEINPAMQWSVQSKKGGHQFGFDMLNDKEEATYKHFYTSNISIKRKILLNNKFDPWFDNYGWEDIELGYRLHKNENLKIIYSKELIAYHHHEISLEQMLNRMYNIGKNINKFQNKHPEINLVPNKTKRTIFFILSNRISIFILKFLNKIFKNKLNNIYFYCLSKRYFLKGLKHAN